MFSADSLGTFTLSNLGMFGVDRFDAILPPGTVSKILFMFQSNSDGQHEFDRSMNLFL